MRTAVWHALFSRWYDHRAAGNRRRAAAFGMLSDAWCHLVWPADDVSVWVTIGRKRHGDRA